MCQSNADHDLGFHHDLPRLIGRRRIFALLGGVGLATAGGLPAAAAQCFALPWETAGPFPADGTNGRNGQGVNTLAQSGVVRADLRSSFGPMMPVADGVDLELELTLVNADGCTSLEDHAIYVWHCDANGRYSLYDLPDANYLRGVGVTDSDGEVSFTTIVPGCYAGRWPHIHFEVFESAEAAVSGQRSVLTAQIALPDMAAAEIYKTDARYADGIRNLRRVSMPADTVFRDNTPQQLAQQTLSMSGDPEDGYTGTLTIPVDFTADRYVPMAPPPGGLDGNPPPGGVGGSLPPPTPLKR